MQFQGIIVKCLVEIRFQVQLDDIVLVEAGLVKGKTVPILFRVIHSNVCALHQLIDIITIFRAFHQTYGTTDSKIMLANDNRMIQRLEYFFRNNGAGIFTVVRRKYCGKLITAQSGHGISGAY